MARSRPKSLPRWKALLWGFHNAHSGLCFDSGARRLRRCVLSWVNRIVRVRERCANLFGRMGSRVRVTRTSKAISSMTRNRPRLMVFSSKSDFQFGNLCSRFFLFPLPYSQSTYR
jgi:hypothetical protein